MAVGHDREQTVTEIGRRRVSAILRSRDEDIARRAMRAAVAGGFRMVEFTLTTPGALDLVAEFAADPELLVGAGTVLTPQDAENAVSAGARFLVSPVTDPEMIRLAHALGVASIPGTATPTEMMTAHRAGADILKIFPAPADVGPFVTQVLGPLPHFRLFPTAGVDEHNFVDVIRRGVYGVGFVSSLFTPEAMASEDTAAIEATARRIVTRLQDLER